MWLLAGSNGATTTAVANIITIGSFLSCILCWAGGEIFHLSSFAVANATGAAFNAMGSNTNFGGSVTS